MKNLLILITILCLTSCAENNIAPISLDQDAASARKNAYTFSLKGEKPYVINLKNANFYLMERTPTRAFMVITDGVHNGLNTILNRSAYTNATWFLWVELYQVLNSPVIESGDYLLRKAIKDTTNFRAHFATEDYTPTDNLVNGVTVYLRYTTPVNAPKLPGYVGQDHYITVQGTVAVGEQVTFSFNNVEAAITAPKHTLLTNALGESSLNFTGTIQDRVYK